MKLLYDFFPIILFFISYKLAGIYTATIVAIAAAVAQVAHYWFKHRRFETMHLVSLALIIVLGGLTLILRDKAFIMWKPTLVNWLFAAVFLATSLLGGKPLIHRMLGSQLELPQYVWRRLNVLWISFFLLAGAVNVLFVQNFQSAENALIESAPHTESQKISDLNCESDFSGNQQRLCERAKAKENLWVQFKLFGMLGLTLVFVIIQGFYLYRFLQPEDSVNNNESADI